MISALLAVTVLAADVTGTPLNAKDPLPKRITGTFLTGLKWQEADGAHLVVLSTVGARSAELHGVHWHQVRGRWQQVWAMSDRVDSCPLDLTCEFVPGSLELSDVDGNGVAEVSLLYRLGCQGGVDPATQKLLLYEGPRKYALRGLEKLVTPEGTSGGDFTADPAFEKVPALLAFAREKWARQGVRTVP